MEAMDVDPIFEGFGKNFFLPCFEDIKIQHFRITC